MTPCEFLALSERYQDSFEVKYILPIVQRAQFASFWANSHIPEGGELTTPDDFIPKMKSSSATTTATEQPARMIANDPVKTSLYLMSLWDAYAVNQKT